MIVTLTLLFFLSSLALFPLVGVSFFPKAEKPQFIINVDTPQGTNLDRTAEFANTIDSLLLDMPEIKHYAVNIGHGNPRIYYNVIPRQNASTHAQFFVTMKKTDLDVYNDLLKDLRIKLGRLPGAKIEVKEFKQGPPVEAPIAIRILGDNLNILKKIAFDVEKIIKTSKGTINVNNPLGTTKTDIRININRDKAGFLGIPLVNIDKTVRASVAGLKIPRYGR